MSGDDDLFGDDFATDAPSVGAPSAASAGGRRSEPPPTVRVDRPADDGGFMPAPIDFSPRDAAPESIPELADVAVIENWKSEHGSRGPAAIVLAAVLALLSPVLIAVWVTSAEARLESAEAAIEDAPAVAVAAAADVGYCTPALKKILRRVLQSCGLLGGEGRGCRPMEAKNVAALSGDDFNALFLPLADRAGILQFEAAESELDASARSLVESIFADQRGASYFFVVSRSSPEGGAAYNQELSRKRGEAVLEHLRGTFDDPDLDRELGLLWLGEEFAQLDTAFCDWQRSRGEDACTAKDINRSAFVAWIDCRL